MNKNALVHFYFFLVLAIIVIITILFYWVGAADDIQDTTEDISQVRNTSEPVKDTQKLMHDLDYGNNYEDKDGDGYGVPTEAGKNPLSEVIDIDCNDSNAGIHPNSTEICGDKIDNNCDGENCSIDCGTFINTIGTVGNYHLLEMDENSMKECAVCNEKEKTIEGNNEYSNYVGYSVKEGNLYCVFESVLHQTN